MVADTSITLAPSSSGTLVLNPPPLTWAGFPSTSTAARAGATRPVISTLGSLTVEGSPGEVTVSRTAGGSGGSGSSPPQPATPSASRRTSVRRDTTGPRLSGPKWFASLISDAHDFLRPRLAAAAGHLADGPAAAPGGRRRAHPVPDRRPRHGREARAAHSERAGHPRAHPAPHRHARAGIPGGRRAGHPRRRSRRPALLPGHDLRRRP